MRALISVSDKTGIVEFATKLANDIKASGFEPDYLVGITKGGLVPLALLAERLDINKIVKYKS